MVDASQHDAHDDDPSVLATGDMATVKVTEQKVILCGEYGVGKTSIFRRFANNTFVASNDRKSTLGLDNIDKEYVVEDRRIRVILLYY